MRRKRWIALGVLLCAVLVLRALTGASADVAGMLARHTARSAVLENPDDLLHLARLCEIQQQLNPLDSQPHYRRAKALHLLAMSFPPNSDTAAEVFGLALGPGVDPQIALLDEAIREYGSASRLDLGQTAALRWSAWALWDKATIDRAHAAALREQALLQMLAAAWIGPTEVPVILDFGDINLMMGDEEHLRRAKGAYSRAMLCQDVVPHVSDKLLELPGGFFHVTDVLPEDPKLYRELSDILFIRGRIAEAAEAWRIASQLRGRTSPQHYSDNLLSNPGFEDQLGDWFHDWHVLPQVGVVVDLTQTVSYAGRSSLMIKLMPGPQNYYHVFQRVPIEGGARYELRGWIKGEDFAPMVELGLEVIHPAGFQRFISASRVKPDDGSWVPLELSFQAPEDVTWMVVRLRRFDPGDISLLGGTIYVDELLLTRMPDPEPPDEPQQPADEAPSAPEDRS
ncbi:MAG: hypothetical protein P9M14_17940 [Candidatus Alcyoniella australis]|nr:hypothetical protein [Candidatus Alcyoniella australis]